MRQAAWPCRIHLRSHRVASSIAGPRPTYFHTATTLSQPNAPYRDAFRKQDETLPTLGTRGNSKAEATSVYIPELSRLESWPALSPSVHEKRCHTINRVNVCIRRRFGGKYSVKPFGSLCYGADTADSDVDLVLMDPDRPVGHEPKFQNKPTPPYYSVSLLGKLLSRAGFNVELMLSQATVPIVTFRDPKTGLKCDLNVNERLGYRNSLMIKRYCTILPILPALILQIKLWAKTQKWITNMNSYTLAIMTIGVLQHHGALPNLQKGVEQKPMTKCGFFWSKGKRGKDYQLRDTRWNLFEEGWKPERTMTADEALLAWFRYWGHEHDYVEKGIDIKRGGVFKRQRDYLSEVYGPEPQPLDPEDQQVVWMNEPEPEDDPSEFNAPLEASENEEPLAWAAHPMCVQDPFIRDKNLTGQMFKSQMKAFPSSCQNALKILEGARMQAPVSVRSDPDQIAKYMASRLLVRRR